MKEAPQIFLSYRRDDSADMTGRIYDRLVQHFGEAAIFRDINTIPLGVDFRVEIDQVISQCSVLLAVIGPDWVKIKDDAGNRRLDDPEDFVRIEIESAIAREIPAIPLLVRGAKIPLETDLPINLKELAYRNAIPIRRDPDFHHDLDRLIAGLEAHLPGIEKEPKINGVLDANPGPVSPTFNLDGNIKAGQINIGGTQFFQGSIEVDMRETHLHQPQGETVMGDKIDMPGNFQDAIVNINSRLDNVAQRISGTPGDETSKTELLKLIEELKTALENVPAEKAGEAESVSKRLEALTREVSEEEPDQEMVMMTGESLKRAAKNLSDVLPVVIPIATNIVSAALKFSGV